MHATRISGLEEAVSSGIGFLLDRQSDAGSWTDWDLPPGRSSTWTTAYLGVRLHELPSDMAVSATSALGVAARWLCDQELPDGGWGYSDRTGCDADTTAHAMLFLTQEGQSISAASRRRLLGFQQCDGGFATYGADDGLGSWGIAHPDVTPVAAQAVQGSPRPAGSSVERAVGYVIRQRSADGLWNSFWWSSPLYATRMCLAFLRAAGAAVDLAPTRRSLSRAPAANAFERALLLDCIHLSGGPADTGLALRLAEEQLADGSWASEPILRIPDRSCVEPWCCEDERGVFADTERLFTSATVVSALSRQSRCYGGPR